MSDNFNNLGSLMYTLDLNEEQFESKMEKIEKKYSKGLSIPVTIFDSDVKNSKELAEYIERVEKSLKGIKRNTPNMSLDIKETNTELKNTTKELGKQGDALSGISGKVKSIFSAYLGFNFVKKMMDVRGELEMQLVSLQAILQNTEKANALFVKTQKLAVQSPYQFKDLIGFTKQLSAFSVPVDELYDKTKMLADVASGLGVEMYRVILAYGQVRSASVLRGQELRQFTEAGIPMVDELAKKFAKLRGNIDETGKAMDRISMGEVFELISARAVPFEMIDEVFEELTSEGGMFHKMQEKQAQTLKGMTANLVDNMDVMFNAMGERYEGFTKGLVRGITSIIENWETWIKLVITGASALATYKTIMFSINKLQALGISGQKLLNTILLKNIRNTYSLKDGVSGIVSLVKKFWGSLSKGNIFAIISAGIIAIITYLVQAHKEANRLKNELMDGMTDVNSELSAQVYGFEKLIDKLKKATYGSKEYADTVSVLNKRYGEYLPSLIKESETLDEILEKTKGVNLAIKERARNMAYERGLSVVDKHSEDIEAPFADLRKWVDSRNKALATRANLTPELLVDLFKKAKDIAVNNDGLDALEVERMAFEIVDNLGLKRKDVYGSVSRPIFTKIAQAVEETISREGRRDKAVEDMLINVDALFGTDKDQPYEKRLKELQEEYQNSVDEIKKQIYSSDAEKQADTVEEKLFEKRKEHLQKTIDIYKEYDQQDQAREFQKELDKLVIISDDWFGLAKKISESDMTLASYKPKDDDTFFTYVDDLKKAYDDIASKQEMISKGANVSDTQKEIIAKQLAGIRQIGEALGIELKRKGSKKDTTEDKAIVEQKQRVDALSQAYKDYLRLLKIMPGEVAESLLKEEKLYKDISIPKTAEEFEKEMMKVHDKLMLLGTKEASTLGASILKKVSSSVVDNMVKDFELFTKTALAKIAKDAEMYKRYKDIFDITGSEAVSMDIAESFNIDFERSSKTITEKIVNAINTLVEDERFNLKLDIDIDEKSDFDEVSLHINNIREAISSMSEDSDQRSILQNIVDEWDNHVLDLAKTYAEDLVQYGSYTDKKLAIENSYKERIESALRAGNETVAKNLESEKNLEIFKVSDEYIKFITEAESMSLSAVVNLKDKIDDMLKSMLRSGSISAKDFNKLWSDVGNTFEDRFKGSGMEILFGESSNVKVKAFTSLLESGLDGTIDKFKDMGDDGTEMLNKMLKLRAVSSMLHNAINQSVEGISDASMAMSTFFDSFGHEGPAQTFADISEYVTDIGSAFTDLTSSILDGDPIGVVTNALTMPFKIASTFAKMHDKRMERRIERSQKRVQEMQLMYEKLERKVDVAFGEDRYAQTGDQIKNLKEQQMELSYQIQKERDKKKTDQHRIKEMQHEIEKIGYEIEDLMRDITDDITGGVESIANSLGDAFYEAFSRGEDYAKGWHDTVDDLVRDISQKLVNQKLIEPLVESVYKKHSERWFDSDGNFDIDKMFNDLPLFAQDLKDAFIPFFDGWEALPDHIKDMIYLSDESRSPLSKGIQGITEESFDLLVSFVGAIRQDVSAIRFDFEYIKEYLLSLDGVMADRLAYLDKINSNVLAIKTVLEAVVTNSSQGGRALRITM